MDLRGVLGWWVLVVASSLDFRALVRSGIVG